MPYAKTVYPKMNMTWLDGIAISLNIALLALIYAALGAVVSYVFYYLFDDYQPHNNDTEWEKRTVQYKLADISIEIVIIALTSFWVVFLLNERLPIFPVHTKLAPFIDSYATGLFFLYAVFVFVDSLWYKIQHMFHEYASPYFDAVFPQFGSLVTLNLRYAKDSIQ